MRPLPPPAAILPRRTARALSALRFVLAVPVLVIAFLGATWVLDVAESGLGREVVRGYRAPGALLLAAASAVGTGEVEGDGESEQASRRAVLRHPD